MWLPPVVWPVHPTSQGGVRSCVDFPAQLSCWNWILKLGMEWRFPVSNWAWNASTATHSGRHGELLSLIFSWFAIILGLCNLINFSDGGVVFWIYFLFETFCFYFMNQIIVHVEFQVQTVCVWCVYSIFSKGFRLRTAPWPHAICSSFRRQCFYINNHHVCLENWCVSKFLFLW